MFQSFEQLNINFWIHADKLGGTDDLALHVAIGHQSLWHIILDSQIVVWRHVNGFDVIGEIGQYTFDESLRVTNDIHVLYLPDERDIAFTRDTFTGHHPFPFIERSILEFDI